MAEYVKLTDKISKQYDVEKKTDGYFEVTISDNNGKHRATLFFGGNIGLGWKEFDTRAEAKVWADKTLIEKKAEYAPVQAASEQWGVGLHWVKPKDGGKYELVDFRKHCGIIQVFHMGWDCSSNLLEFDISSIVKAQIIDPDGNEFVLD